MRPGCATAHQERPSSEAGGFPAAAKIAAWAQDWKPLLPLPRLLPPQKGSSRSHRLRARCKRKLMLWQSITELTDSLNWLDRGGRPQRRQRPPPCALADLEGAQRRAILFLAREAWLMLQARREFPLTGAQALASVMRTTVRGTYSMKVRAETPHVRLKADLVDEPSDESFVPMLEALPAGEAAFYACEENVIDHIGKSTVLFEEIQEHFGYVNGSLDEYARYFNRKDLPSTMWSWGTAEEVKGVAGFSQVLKKNGVSQRKLLMQCASNYWWGDVRRRQNHGLGGGAALALVHAPSTGWDISAFDESNAFTYIMTPPWMWRWCAAPPLPAALVREKLPDRLRFSLEDDHPVYPMYCRLAMGGSHSVHILMSINTQILGSTLRRSSLLGTFESTPEPAEGEPEDERHECPLPGNDEVALHRDDEVRFKKISLLGEPSLDEFTEACYHARRCGRRIFTFVHFFAGRQREQDLEDAMRRACAAEHLEAVILGVDLVRGPSWDLLSETLTLRMMHLIQGGYLDGAAGGPPCSTWSAARYLYVKGGPRPLRRRGAYSWGLPDLRPWEHRRVSEGSHMILFFM